MQHVFIDYEKFFSPAIIFPKEFNLYVLEFPLLGEKSPLVHPVIK